MGAGVDPGAAGEARLAGAPNPASAAGTVKWFLRAPASAGAPLTVQPVWAAVIPRGRESRPLSRAGVSSPQSKHGQRWFGSSHGGPPAGTGTLLREPADRAEPTVLVTRHGLWIDGGHRGEGKRLFTGGVAASPAAGPTAAKLSSKSHVHAMAGAPRPCTARPAPHRTRRRGGHVPRPRHRRMHRRRGRRGRRGRDLLSRCTPRRGRVVLRPP